MKLTKANLDLLLTQLGLQGVQIVEDEKEADEFSSDTIIQNFLNSKEPIFRQKYDTEILPEKLKEEAGKFGGKLKTTLRKLSNNVLKTSDFEGKSDDEALKVFVDFLNANKDASAEELREQIRQLGETHHSELEQLKSEYEDKISKQAQKFDEINMEGFYSEILGQIPLIGDNPKSKIEVLKNAINSKYKPIWNEEKKEVELRDLQNPEKMIIVDGSNILTPKAYAEQFFKDLGMIKTDTSTEKATNYVEAGSRTTGQDYNPNGLAFQDFEKVFAGQ